MKRTSRPVPGAGRRVPSLARLTRGLSAALGAGENQAVTVVERRDEMYRSTFPSEVITCRLEDGRRLRLFCKYSKPVSDPPWHRSYGHRGGIAYEAQVYEHVLRPLGVSTTALHGIYRDAARHQTWLFLEHLDDAAFVKREPSLLPEAAGWIGRFHALSERRLGSPELVFLRRYDGKYYRGWARRVLAYGRRFKVGGRWLANVCEGFEEDIRELLAAPHAVIHGEYYPPNVLVRNGRIRPVDWETAAIACGEIDVASLTENWSARVSRECERAYARARWPRGAPPGFQRRLRAARFYMLLRWAGEPRAWSAPGDRAFYMRQLRSAGERLGLC